MLAAVRAGGLRLAGAAFLLASTFPLVGAVPAACAGEGSRAVLVVDTGESEYRMCVELPRAQVSGTDLIVLAGEQHGLSYRFGHGGGAVCMLGGVGADGDDCFEKYPDFWGYWRGDGSGGWTWSSSGAGSTRVSNGDVEGWSWGSGSDGSSHPPPPRTTFSSVCTQATPKASSPPAPEPQTEKRERPAPSQRRAPRNTQRNDVAVVAPDSASDDSAERRPRSKRAARSEERERQRGRARPNQRGAVAPSPGAVIDTDDQRPLGATDEPRSGGGPPPAGVAAVVAAGALGGAGTWLARRRRPRP